MDKLFELLDEDEKVYCFGVTSYYRELYFIAKNDNDISASLEDTLRRLLKADLDPCYYMGAFIPSEEEMAEYEKYDDYTYIDLGYILGGQITTVYELER